jgi:tetraacyldisaccharide 4'-kinase
MISAIKNTYLSFIEQRQKNIVNDILFGVLIFLSRLYGAAVCFINFCYNKNIFHVYRSAKPVICVGNISWGGSGKSTLVLKIREYLKNNFKTAVLRRGYGIDEEAMLKGSGGDIYSNKDRVALVHNLENDYDCFILDDGFQYRRLCRTYDIVVMGAREFNHVFHFIPAYIFREPLSSLKRAGLVVINYKSELKNAATAVLTVKKYTNAPVFLADYRITHVKDAQGHIFSPTRIAQLKTAAATAIGYPQGFFNKLKAYGVNAQEEVVYPDHHELNKDESNRLSILLAKKAITHIIVTMKDKNRFDSIVGKFTVLFAEIEMTIDNEDGFRREIVSVLGK